MGRKSKRSNEEQVEEKEDIFCFYCKREFDDEKTLILHQKAKHFKCPECHKLCPSIVSLCTHSQQVHKQKLETIPGAIEGRVDPTKYQVYGMTGIPREFLSEEQKAKMPKLEQTSYQQMPPGPGPVQGQGQGPGWGVQAPPYGGIGMGMGMGMPPSMAPIQNYGGYQRASANPFMYTQLTTCK